MDQYRLVKECLKGKVAAQKQLYNLFAPSMLAVCYRYTKSLADAEDVLQEGFIKVFFNLHQFKSEGELGGWIRRIMVTTAINFLKKNSHYQTELL
ncbi:MAG TPA: sigma-70 family RNA polymerase sigma factor, partial [Flavisolibacter sp.]|nr:sigma-70 family RNA polymerase sigma factor [Flavisolibacter sp.]